MGDPLGLLGSFVTILDRDHLNRSVSKDAAGHKESIRDEQVKILGLNQGVPVSRIRTRIAEGIQTESSRIGIRSRSAVEGIIKGRTQQGVVTGSPNQVENHPINRLNGDGRLGFRSRYRT